MLKDNKSIKLIEKDQQRIIDLCVKRNTEIISKDYSSMEDDEKIIIYQTFFINRQQKKIDKSKALNIKEMRKDNILLIDIHQNKLRDMALNKIERMEKLDYDQLIDDEKIMLYQALKILENEEKLK